jgi:hypothetical protein
MTALHYAASAGHAANVSLYLSFGANPNAIDYRGATPLHWAVYEGFQYTAMLLVGQGRANMAIQDWYTYISIDLSIYRYDIYLYLYILLF